MRRGSRLVGCAGVLVALAVAGPVRAGSAADEAAAETLFSSGKSLMQAQRYEEACAKLDASRRLSPGIGITMWLADCHEHAGRLATAWLDFREAASLARTAHDGRLALAESRAAALEPKLAKLRIVASGYPGDVYRDDVRLPPGALGVEIPIDRGHYRIRFVPREGPARLVVLDVTENGRVHDVRPEDGQVQAEAPAPAAAPAAAASPPPSAPAAAPAHDRSFGWVLLGVAAAGLGVSAGFGIDAANKKSDSNDGHCTGNTCDARGVELRDDAFRSATVSTIGVGVGAAALVAGTLVLLGVFDGNAKDGARNGAKSGAANTVRATRGAGGAFAW